MRIKPIIAGIITGIILVLSTLTTSIPAFAATNYDGTWKNTSKNFTMTVKGDKVSLPAGEYKFSFYDVRLGLIEQTLNLSEPITMKVKNNNFVQTLYEINYGINSNRSTGRIKIYGSFKSQNSLDITITYEESIYYLKESSYGDFTLHKVGSGDKYINILPDMDTKLASDLQCLNDAAWNGDKYIIAGRGRILSSTDGKKWNVVYKKDFSHVLFGIVWSGKEFVAVGNNETDNSLWTLISSDGVKWKEYTQPSKGYVSNIAWNGKLYVVTTSEGIYTSSTGKKWSLTDTPDGTQSFGYVIYAGKYFVTTGIATEGKDAGLYYSKDGKEWVRSSYSPGQDNLRKVTYLNGKYYFLQQSDSSSTLVSTSNFKSFTKADLSSVFGTDAIYVMSADQSKLIVSYVNYTGNSSCGIMSSKDGKSWSKDLDLEQSINNIVLVNKKVIIVGTSTIYISR